MTEIIYNHKKNKYKLSAQGHANTDGTREGGAVCTAISTLLQTLIQCVSDNAKAKSYIKGGNVRIEVITDNPEIETMFNMALTGLMMIQHKYPQYIIIKDTK